MAFPHLAAVLVMNYLTVQLDLYLCYAIHLSKSFLRLIAHICHAALHCCVCFLLVQLSNVLHMPLYFPPHHCRVLVKLHGLHFAVAFF